MENTKKRTALWLYPEVMDEMDKNLSAADTKNRSEFIEKAILFYLGYLKTGDSSQFLSTALRSSLEGAVKGKEERMANNLFRLSVETSMMMHLLATAVNVEEEELAKLRGLCVQEIKRNKGKIKLEDAIDFQKRDDEDDNGWQS